MPQLHADLTKNTTVPVVSGGTLWADEVNKVFHLYGGEYSEAPDEMGLWSYDLLLNQWNRSDRVPTNIVKRVAWGAGATVNARGEGYYLGGWISNLTEPSWSGTPWATSSLIKYDFVRDVWVNYTGPDTSGRAEGVMLYLPASDSGLLIYFGGIVDSFRNGTVVGVSTEPPIMSPKGKLTDNQSPMNVRWSPIFPGLFR